MPSQSSRLYKDHLLMHCCASMSGAHHNPETPLRSAAGCAIAVWETTANHIGASGRLNDTGDERAEVRDAVTEGAS